VDFKAKLAALTGAVGRATPAPTEEVAPPLPGAVVAPASAAEIGALITARESPFGSLHLAEQRHLRAPKICAASLGALSLSPELASIDTSRLFFLDTETTGLAGGTGTLAFLIGTAFFEGEALVVQQLHLPGPGQERPMLLWLEEKLAWASALVTFNGKSFDWPLIRNRFVMNRLPAPRAVAHIDLLHCARRAFRHHLAEMRLGALEEGVLGVVRRGDIAGADIPSAWFDFLRTGRVARLSRVLEHNARDVLSMVDLIELLIAAWRQEHEVAPAVAMGLATVAARARDFPRALRFASLAAESDAPAVRLQALKLEAALLRKGGDARGAARALEAALPLAAHPAPLHLALAKLFEHRLGDVVAARHHALLAAAAEGTEAHARRRNRLHRQAQLRLHVE
jgi:uncharacterized protein YprB with RNaseH-like and TPR domain